MDHCCEDKSCEITAMRERHGRVLWVVLIINAVMFLVEGVAGLTAQSTSLLADALDMLGDALVYGFSLFVLARSAHWQAGAALAKGGFMLAFGLGVLGEAAYKVFHPVMPGVETMGVIGGLALVANLVCFFLLYRHRSDNLNMSSTWLCSRTDLMANAGVLMAAAGIYGLIQYSIATRTREIGLRIAVGAQAGDIFRMIIGEGLMLSVTGVALGLVGALWLGRAASSLLFGVTASDPLTFTTVSLLLTAVAIAACYFPARRAMRVDPLLALRAT